MENFVADDEHGTKPRLFDTANSIQVRPVDFSPQYGGHMPFVQMHRKQK